VSIPDWATTTSGVLAVLAAIWAIHRYITKSIIRDYLSELKPNGGSSLRDEITRLSAQMEIVLKILEKK
jgi:hypothetical protein